MFSITSDVSFDVSRSAGAADYEIDHEGSLSVADPFSQTDVETATYDAYADRNLRQAEPSACREDSPFSTHTCRLQRPWTRPCRRTARKAVQDLNSRRIRRSR